MNTDLSLFPSLDFIQLQKWAVSFVEDCFPSAGISKITLHDFKRKIEGASAIPGADHLQNTSFEFLCIIHLGEKEINVDLDQRKSLIRAVHSPTIWDAQTYLKLGIDAKFKNCFNKFSPSTDNESLFQAMKSFSFWVLTPKNDDTFPENGFGWPYHIDNNSDFWQLYPGYSVKSSQQADFSHMKYFSEITDAVTGDVFISIEEAETLMVPSKITQLLNSYRIMRSITWSQWE